MSALGGGLSARRRGGVLTDLALTGIQRGDLDQTVAYARAALEIAQRTGSGFLAHKLRGMQVHMASIHGASEVDQLDAEIAALTRVPDTVTTRSEDLW